MAEETESDEFLQDIIHKTENLHCSEKTLQLQSIPGMKRFYSEKVLVGRLLSFRNLSGQRMWKLEVAKGHDPGLFSANNFVGRQVWKFEPDLGAPEEHEEVEKARQRFSKNRFQVKASSDALKNLQVARLSFNLNEDGGWGIHLEMSHSTMLSTALNLLGQELEKSKDGAVSMGQKWIMDHGGVTNIQIWGKIYLSVLGVYEWAGCDPVPPEFLLVPSFLPFSPGKLWCYLRTLYTPMAYLYGKRFVGPIMNLFVALRKGLYIQPYVLINRQNKKGD
ncbi:lupeol synthase, putative [Ricinus communis]|uniref:Lupeol synthase, putative n=1 Tax=Ricinus communis TaxID=3988 RepID=B9S100_RICCO|nr:lupeol synthase, putative [Ricinus communis]